MDKKMEKKAKKYFKDYAKKIKKNEPCADSDEEVDCYTNEDIFINNNTPIYYDSDHNDNINETDTDTMPEEELKIQYYDSDKE